MTGRGGWPGEQPSCRRRGERSHRPEEHPDGPALTCEEQRGFDEIARRIGREAVTVDPSVVAMSITSRLVPVRPAALGLLVIGAVGVLIGLIWRDLVILTVAGVVPLAGAAILIAVAGRSGIVVDPPAGQAAGRRGPRALLARFHSWLTTCATNGCDNKATHLGWCSEHAPAFDPGPDEYWGDPWDDAR